MHIPLEGDGEGAGAGWVGAGVGEGEADGAGAGVGEEPPDDVGAGRPPSAAAVCPRPAELLGVAAPRAWA
jgi:hypothetical protein